MELLNDKLTVTLNNLGRTERTKPLESNNPMDAVLHEFRVAGFLRTYGEKRYDRAKTALKKAFDDRLAQVLVNAMGKVVKLNATQTVELLEAEHHTLVAQVNPAATYLDSEGLKLKLKMLKNADGTPMISAADVDNLFISCTKRYNPTTTYVVANKLEERIQ